MAALHLCMACDTYQKGPGPFSKCQRCGVEGEIVREREADEGDEE